MILLAALGLPTYGRTLLIQALRAAYSEAMSQNILFPQFNYTFFDAGGQSRYSFDVRPENYADLNEMCSVSSVIYPSLEQIKAGSALSEVLTRDIRLKIGVFDAQGVDASTFSFYLSTLYTLFGFVQRHYNSTALLSFDVQYGQKSADGFDFVYGVQNTDWHSSYYPLCSVVPNRVALLGQQLNLSGANCVSLQDLANKTFVVLYNSKHQEILASYKITPVIVYSAEALVSELRNNASKTAFADFYYLKAAQLKNLSLELIEVCPESLRSRFWLEPQRILLLPDTEILADVVHGQLNQKIRRNFYSLEYGQLYGNKDLKQVISKAISNAIQQKFFNQASYPFSLRASSIASFEDVSTVRHGASCEPSLPDLQYVSYNSILEDSLLSQIIAHQRIRVASSGGLTDASAENDIIYSPLDQTTPIETYMITTLAAELSNQYGVMIRPVVVAAQMTSKDLLKSMQRLKTLKYAPEAALFDVVLSGLELTSESASAGNFGIAYIYCPLRAVGSQEIKNFQALIAAELVYVKPDTAAHDLIRATSAKYALCDNDTECVSLASKNSSHVFLTTLLTDAPGFKANIMPEYAQIAFALRFDDRQIDGIRDAMGRAVGTFALVLACAGFALCCWGLLRLGKKRNERST